MSENDFAVRDRRRFGPNGEPVDSGAADSSGAGRSESAGEKPRTGKGCEGTRSYPVVTFSTFVFSLGSSALINFGELPDPQSRRTCKDLAMAKQTIDVLAMLQEKTRGNLDQEEQQLMTNLLYELRMKYVAAARV